MCNTHTDDHFQDSDDGFHVDMVDGNFPYVHNVHILTTGMTAILTRVCHFLHTDQRQLYDMTVLLPDARHLDNERERERDRQTERQSETETDRDTERETVRDRQTETETEERALPCVHVKQNPHDISVNKRSSHTRATGNAALWVFAFHIRLIPT